MTRNVHIEYFAMLREDRGCSTETVATAAATAGQLYDELQARHHLRLPRAQVRPIVNGEVTDWSRQLEDGQTVAFLPPVAGG